MNIGRAAAAMACALATGCAGATPRPERQAAVAVPQPDPSCRTTVQEPLARYGLEEVVVTLALHRNGRAEIVDFLSPDLTPAQKLDFRVAIGSCPWAPVPKDGAVELFTTHLVREGGR